MVKSIRQTPSVVQRDNIQTRPTGIILRTANKSHKLAEYHGASQKARRILPSPKALNWLFRNISFAPLPRTASAGDLALECREKRSPLHCSDRL